MIGYQCFCRSHNPSESEAQLQYIIVHVVIVCGVDVAYVMS